MTEPGGTDPNSSGWSDAGAQPQWGSTPQQPGWGAGAPPPEYGGGYGAPPGFGPPPGYGAQGYGPGYGQPPYGYYGAPQTDGKAVGALVCAIAAWVVCPFVTAVVALILASQSSRDIRNSSGRLGGEGMNTAARIIAWINIGLSVLFLLFFFAAFSASA